LEPRRALELALPDGRVRIVRRAELAALPGGVADVGALVPKRSGAAARLSALLDAHDVPAAGSAVLCAADGFASEPVPLSALREGWLVHSQGDAALPREQGGPELFHDVEHIRQAAIALREEGPDPQLLAWAEEHIAAAVEHYCAAGHAAEDIELISIQAFDTRRSSHKPRGPRRAKR
jgi:hypothetical protein